MVYRWLSRGWFALGILFVLLAMMVTLVRVGGPLLNQYRESLIHTLLGDSQLKVSVGQVGLDWTQSGPALELQQLAIAPDSGRFTVQLGKAWVHLDFWRTLNQLKPVFGELILSDGDITLDFSQPANSREPEGDAQQGALLRFLLTQLTTFDVHNTRLSVTTSVGDLRALDIAQLRWQNRGKRHQGVGKAYLINGVGESTIDLILDVDAPTARLDRLKGQLYLGARQLDISPILAKIHAGEPKLAGQIDFQLWSEFDHGKLGNTLLEFGNNYLIWKDLKDQGLHRLGLDGGKIQLRRDGQNWQLASHDVIFKLDDKPWLHSRLQLERVGERVQGYVPQIDLDQIAQLSQLVSGIYPAQSELLKQSKPKGKLTNLTLQADAGWQDLSLSGQIAHVSLNAWHDVPGFGDLNGEFWLTPKGGSASVALLNDKLDPARHFKEPIPVDRFSARLDWWREAQGWVLYGQDIAL
ncbi:MAG: YhdP family protein, partial [Aeromonas sobria]